MKSNHLLYLPLSLLILCAGISACKKQIAVGPPITQLVTSNVFNDNGTATAAQLNIYVKLAPFPYALHQATGLSADEFSTSTIDQVSRRIFNNSLTASDATTLFSTFLFWRSSYINIYAINAVIENLQHSSGVSSRVKQQLTGEAQFTRAWSYFYLVNLFGDVPLATTTDYKVNSALPRTPKAQVYKQIVEDLTNAQGNLSTKYIDASDTAETVDRIRPTVWAAHALLAKVYLYMGNGYSKQAEDQATAVINNATLFSLPADLNAVFKENSNEAIWQIAAYNGTDLTFAPDGNNFVLTSGPGSGATNSTTISNQLMNAFESGDQRKVNWIGTFNSGTNAWNYPAKYKDNSITAASPSEYTMALRLGEQYLIRAEARAQQGNIAGAVADLNTIRNRAGLANYAGKTDQAAIINAITHERQVELFAEGDRWLNLKRIGTVDAVMKVVVPQKGGSTWNSYQQLYPIPPTEILNDLNLTQNPGY